MSARAHTLNRDRMGIGGHSYGAFSTLDAMTLVPHFKAGIAGDGMYNRSLTPFGFQSERRNFYEAKETYLDMSPFLRADKISGALAGLVRCAREGAAPDVHALTLYSTLDSPHDGAHACER